MNKNSNLQSGLLRGMCLVSLCCIGLFIAGCDTAQSTPRNQPASTLANDFTLAELPERINAINRDINNGIRATLIGEGSDTLLLLDLDPARIEPMLIAEPNTGISAQQALTDHNLLALVGSGFVSELASLAPVGLLRVEGETLSPVLGHGYTRILGLNDQGMGVVHRNEFESGLFHSAIQVGPGVVEQGQLDISERDLARPMYFRSFITLCEDRWLAGASLAPTHLRTMGQTLLAYFQQQKWQCDDVINLAGDRQTLLMVNGPNGIALSHGDPKVSKVSLIGFKHRQ